MVKHAAPTMGTFPELPVMFRLKYWRESTICASITVAFVTQYFRFRTTFTENANCKMYTSKFV